MSWISSVGSPDLPHTLLQPAKCLGGWQYGLHQINSLVLWRAIGFCQWGAPIGHCRKGGWSGQSIRASGSSWHGDPWLGVSCVVTASLKITPYTHPSFQVSMTAPSPNSFRSTSAKTLVVTTAYYTISCGLFNLYPHIPIRKSCSINLFIKLSWNYSNMSVWFVFCWDPVWEGGKSK